MCNIKTNYSLIFTGRKFLRLRYITYYVFLIDFDCHYIAYTHAVYSIVHMYMFCVHYYCHHVIIIVSLFQWGNTCLHTSSQYAVSSDAVAFFISKGLDVNATNNVSIIMHCSNWSE